MWLHEPTPGDVLHVARNMREMDAREILDIHKSLDRDAFAAVASTMIPGALVAIGAGLDGAPFCAAVLLVCSSESKPWLAEASLFATDDFPLLARPLIRFVRQRVIPALIADGVRRVEARVLESYAVSRRFLRACGAVEEFPMPDHGPAGQRYVMCAWRRSDFLVEGADVPGRSAIPEAGHR